MANAREYLDRRKVSLFYPLPFSDNYDINAIYFQPLTLTLALVLYLSKVDPGVLFIIFGLLFTFLCISKSFL